MEKKMFPKQRERIIARLTDLVRSIPVDEIDEVMKSVKTRVYKEVRQPGKRLLSDEEEKKLHYDKQNEIKSVLDDYGTEVTEIQTDGRLANGSWDYEHVDFSYKGLAIHIYIGLQPEGLGGHMYRPLRDVDEADSLKWGYSKNFLAFQKEFNYRQFMIYGPTPKVMKEIMRLAELPIDEIISLQEEDGFIRKSVE